jgi:hypothetical protein
MSSENNNISDYEKFRSELRNRREEWGGNGVKNLTGTLKSLPFFAVYYHSGTHFRDEPNS